MDNSISNNNAEGVKIIRSTEDINSLKNINDKAKLFINSAFEELDTANGKPDGILQRSEGEIHVFEDGAISVVKNGKLVAGMSAEGAEARMIGDTLQIKFNDGSESIIKNNELISGKTSSNRAFKKVGNEIVFEDTKQPEKKQESAKVENNVPTPVSTGSINGVKKQKIDDIAKEYIKIASNTESFSEKDINNWVKQKAEFNAKYQNTFKKLLGKPEAYKNGELNTDVYNLKFSPVLNTNSMKFFWELFNVEEIK